LEENPKEISTVKANVRWLVGDEENATESGKASVRVRVHRHGSGRVLAEAGGRGHQPELQYP
jgi:hypothetical protein